MPSNFKRNVPLVVVHGHDAVELAVARTDHQRVGRKRAFDIDARTASPLDGGSDRRLFFVTEQARFAGVWIERTDGNARRPALRAAA